VVLRCGLVVASPRTRRWRWLVPPVLVGLLWTGYTVRDRLEARAEPTLPKRTAAEVAEMAASPHPQPRSGFLELRTSLGLGDFGTATGESGGSLVGLASGSNDARLWQDGDRRRIALLQELGETDWYRNGDVTYVWHSRRSRVTKVSTPTEPPSATGVITSLAGGGTIESPDGMAMRFLALRNQSTRLVLHAPTYVADRPAYQLGLIPDVPTSLITEVTIGVDAETGLPLRVQVKTRSGTVAIDGKFTSISFKRPAASHFDFRPPPEAKVTNGDTVSREPDYSDDWERERDRERALEDVQSVTGVNETLLRLATTGEGWNEVVAVTGLDWWRLEDLGRTAKTVTGPYGTGELLETPVFSLLILPGGRIVAGAVTAEGLEPAAVEVASR
jgi:outer membrane lipoprotein-sorting protein